MSQFLLSSFRPLLATAALALMVATATPAQTAVDPFYANLYRQGVQATARGDHEGAIKLLRLAGFGMLDEPLTLADCLTRLALAEAASSDDESFLGTFNRLAEVEKRFSAYSRAEIASDVRRAFEEQLEQRVDYEDLRQVPAFRDIAKRRLLSEIESMPVAQRRQELARWIAAEPEESAWRLMAARLELAEDKPAAALENIEAVLTRAPSHDEATCLGRRARLHLGSCETTAEQLAGCVELAAETDLAAALISCQIDREQWTEADALLSSLPADVRRRGRFRGFARQIRRGVNSRPTPPSQAADPTGKPIADAPSVDEESLAETATAEPQTRSDDAEPQTRSDDAEPQTRSDDAAAAPRLPAERQAHLAEASELLMSGDRRALVRASELAFELANDFPDHPRAQHLAAEIAYRLSHWQDAVLYFGRGGFAPERPELLFYYAVALYETGDQETARRALRRCLDRIERTPFVETYARKILAEDG